ncbi:SPOSA6832_03107 [Sporobolomyces salmonicolor]|uniref:SPOSA6832_03107-mRNA-1:cds n=1 Tax=Sporidiobolus salmonicolor TaxID=5005 RepID=A0A0D6END8_SPOSA|nr:SPOSA6832_03107 [Sporobolomyces salmonicolor]
MVAPAVQYPRTDFPEDLECHPLLVVDYEKVAAGDEKEIDVLYSACTNLGFFYLTDSVALQLKNFGFEDLTEPMFEMGSATFSLPEEELLPFEQGDSGMSAGYKRGGSTNVDAKGNVDTIQFINVAKDDALAYPEVRQRTYPTTVVERIFAVPDDCLQTLMAALEPRIGLPKGTLAALHKEGDISGSESRCILKPAPGDKGYLPEGVGEDGNPSAALGAHTDFGSRSWLIAAPSATSDETDSTTFAAVSMLHGRGCGGLQVLPPGTSKWQHIRPLPGHAVCNVGDTLSVYSGRFPSQIHRVIPPPPPQDTSARWSLVYFLRPGFNNELRPLVAKSAIIARHAAQDPAMQSLPKGATAGEWFKRRVSKQRAANRKGPETWAESRGTEHSPAVA